MKNNLVYQQIMLTNQIKTLTQKINQITEIIKSNEQAVCGYSIFGINNPTSIFNGLYYTANIENQTSSLNREKHEYENQIASLRIELAEVEKSLAEEAERE